MSEDRTRRLAERVHEIVAQLLETRVKDPRLGLVTVTGVKVTGDQREATVFYTCLGDEGERAASAAALRSATGMLRTGLGRALGTRHTPSLAFVPDGVPENAAAIDDLLRAAAERDAAVGQLAAGAAYAGEAQPYRTPAADAQREDPQP